MMVYDGATFIPHDQFAQIENAYLLTPEWREFRNRALIYYSFRCAVCGFGYKDRHDHLEVDHKRYWKNGSLIFGWEDVRKDVRLLCSLHHLKGVHSDSFIRSWRVSYLLTKLLLWLLLFPFRIVGFGRL